MSKKLAYRARWPKTFSKFVDEWLAMWEEEDPDMELSNRYKRVLDKMEVGEWFTTFHPYNDEMLSYSEI